MELEMETISRKRKEGPNSALATELGSLCSLAVLELSGDQAGLKLRDPSASASLVLGLKTKTKWTEMSAVYVGPFFKNFNIGAVKKTFNSLGPVQSITLVLETSRLTDNLQSTACLAQHVKRHPLWLGPVLSTSSSSLSWKVTMVKTLVFLQPYFCIQYEVLEAAQLAIETMNGILVEGSYIRVHRHVTEFTLECDTLMHQLEQDSENQATIYVSGLGKTFKEHLLEQSSLFPDLEAVILPKDVKRRKQKNYCFLNSEGEPSKDSSLALWPED